MSNYYTKKKKRQWLTSPYMLLTFRLLTALVLLSVSRWMMYVFNMPLFQGVELPEALKLYFVGLRFDLVVLAYLNIPLILYYCFPVHNENNNALQKTIDIIYIVANSTAFMLNVIDILYFRFIGKSISTELFQFFGNSNANSGGLAIQIFTDYWYMLLIGLLFVIVLIVVARWTKLRHNDNRLTSQWYLGQIASLLIFTILTIIACRGGMQPRPVNVSTALRYTTPQNVPIILNTPFAVIKGSAAPTLNEYHFTDHPSFSPIHHLDTVNRYLLPDDSIANNVVLIILDSYGQEMSGYYNPYIRHRLTPFLDSLLGKSLTFDGMANGQRSVESLPALLSGIPSLMDAYFLTSSFRSNDIDGLGTQLKKHGYQTSFFHSGYNNTIDVASFAKRAGFDRYFGRSEYYSHTDQDIRKGNIDVPFLQYAIRIFDTTQTPFASVVFTTSTHRRARLPEHFELPPDGYSWSNIEKSIYYTDCALRRFFAEASTKEWYDNTLFVITSNHSNTEHHHPKYNNIWGMYKIPIAFFQPKSIAPEKTSELAQQTDLNVSILSALCITDTVFSFGRNVFDSLSKPFTISYLNHSYHYSDGKYLIQSDGTKTIGVYRIDTDSLLHNNLIDHIQCPDLHNLLSEHIQEYNNRMIHNILTVDNDYLNGKTEDTIHY